MCIRKGYKSHLDGNNLHTIQRINSEIIDSELMRIQVSLAHVNLKSD